MRYGHSIGCVNGQRNSVDGQKIVTPVQALWQCYPLLSALLLFRFFAVRFEFILRMRFALLDRKHAGTSVDRGNLNS
jgi:hypothetical protein